MAPKPTATVKVKYQGRILDIPLSNTSSTPNTNTNTSSTPNTNAINSLKLHLQAATGIPADAQKLIRGGKVLDSLDQLPANSTLMLVGTKALDLQNMERQNQVRANSTPLPQGKAYVAAKPNSPYSFHRIESLLEFNDSDRAISYLARLRDDKGVVEVMKSRHFSVGLLKELHPLRDASILGYNRGKGLEIALRLRTDDLLGFRHYKEVKRVLMHELAHMIHSAHDEKFHALNRELDAQVIRLDWTLSKGQTISGDDFYQPLDEDRYQRLLERPDIIDDHGHEDQGHVLGHSETASDSEQDKRKLAEQAALKRLGRS